jgi:hypothetical protein
MQGRITKTCIGSSVMAFQNKNSSAYDLMVKRRLVTEGKNPESFELGLRKWGERVPNLPLIRHEKDEQVRWYLEVIFLKAGEVQYFLDNQSINKNDIIGLQETPEGGQGGLEKLVIIRSFALDSITRIRINHEEYEGPFNV